MTQEEKQLLLKDLCARLPYNNTMVRVEILDENHAMMKGGTQDDELSIVWVGIVAAGNPYHIIKPYLRPMSSMTEEEKEEYNNARSDYYDDLETYDWLNAHHFDYRGLIEKGLALEAPEDMYKTE